MFYKEYIENVSFIRDDKHFEQLYNSLPKWRRDMVLLEAPKHNRYMSVLSGYALCKAFDENNVKDTNVCFNEYGKPYLVGADNLYFSMSHSNDLVYVVVSDCEVGCDVEYMRERDFLKLSARYFAEDETKILSVLENPKEKFYKLWTAKEAYIKAVGKGLSVSLDSFDVGNLYGYSLIKNKIEDDYAFSIVVKK